MRSSRSMSELQGDIQQFANWVQEDAESNTQKIKQMKQKVRDAIESELTPRQKQVLLIALSKGFSQTQIAQELGVDKSTISRTMSRAIKRLRRVLKYAT